MKRVFTLLFSAFLLGATELTANDSLSLQEALDVLKSQNLEIKTAFLDIDAAKADIDKIEGKSFGKLDFTQNFARSNDAGNVFGFKLTSREASFGDFGFSQFLGGIGQTMQYAQSLGGDGFTNFTNIMTDPQTQSQMLATEPTDLNYPDARNFFQSKLTYEVPLFTGFMLTNYEEVMESVKNIKSLQKDQMINEKIYQLRKSFYDMALLRESTKNLNTILENINILENMTQTMIDEGYAKKIDLLEVQAKKGNVDRLLMQMNSNQQLLLHYISFLLNQKVTDITTPECFVPEPIINDGDVLSNNLDIKQANQGLEVRKNMVDLSKAAYFPMVGGFAEVATADDAFMNDISDHKAYTVGARLTWNIFNGGSDNAELEKSKIEHLKMKTQLELAKKGIMLQFDKIKTELKTCDDEIESLKKELKLADAIYENYVGRYKEKLSSMSDVIIKQSEQIQKILELQMANNKRNEKIFQLEKLANTKGQL